jgi:Uma2 family endonuclease
MESYKMAIVAQQITAEEFEKLNDTEARLELVKGAVITMPPAGHEHGEIALAIGAALHAFVRQNKLGKVYAAETGFILARHPDTVRAPDAAFASAERVNQQRHKEGFFDGPPDLAVEVVSPQDTDEEVEAKVLDYLQNGVRMVWIIRPRTRTITTYRSMKDIRLLTEADVLSGENVLPGFTIPVRELLSD